MTSAPVDASHVFAGHCGTCRAVVARLAEWPRGLLCLECFQRARQMSAFVPREERLPFGMPGMAAMTPTPTRQAAHRRVMLAHLLAQRDTPVPSGEPELA